MAPWNGNGKLVETSLLTANVEVVNKIRICMQFNAACLGAITCHRCFSFHGNLFWFHDKDSYRNLSVVDEFILLEEIPNFFIFFNLFFVILWLNFYISIRRDWMFKVTKRNCISIHIFMFKWFYNFESIIKEIGSNYLF